MLWTAACPKDYTKKPYLAQQKIVAAADDIGGVV
jgi:hypothetical protein